VISQCRIMRVEASRARTQRDSLNGVEPGEIAVTELALAHGKMM